MIDYFILLLIFLLYIIQVLSPISSETVLLWKSLWNTDSTLSYLMNYIHTIKLLRVEHFSMNQFFKWQEAVKCCCQFDLFTPVVYMIV